MVNGIFDYMDTIEYPSDDELVEGVGEGVSFDYVATTYLNGFINYVQIIDAYMIRRYKTLEKYLVEKYGTYDQCVVEGKIDPNNLTWERSCQLIDSLSEGSNFHFTHTADKFDDMLILAKQAGSYWVFWTDCDCSSSCIGRLPIYTFASDNEAKEALKISAMEFSTEDSTEEDEKIKQIPLKFFSGWITL